MRMRFVPLMLTFPLLVAASPAPPTSAPSMQARCDALLAKWKARFDAERVHALVAPPFVIAGDGSTSKLQRYRDETILASMRALQSMYFRTPPAEPILILLFESEKPYRRLGKTWFNDDDLPHFGLYRHQDRVMLMNVATGTGTLVHELVHALIEPDFPGVPDWFNEGLASLYEQSSIDGATITGLANWRLPALQKAIKDDSLRSFEELIGDDDFRNDARIGINYAQSRYLMMYLQEKGLMRKYYVRFRDASKSGDDASGLASLKKVIAPQKLDEFEKDWRAWVLTLRFGE